ncbi:MAG TPA: hypothetical protein VK427_13575 [Kofleriaceae bacterium]|nr:hypothetical protein [Kofleriaceae bacterium]
MQAMFTISGTATSRNLGGSSPEAGVLVAAYAKTDENTPIAMGTTDASGVFMLTITSNGTALDGFLKATKSGFTTSYLYPPRPVTADLAMVPMNMLTTGNFDTLYTLAAVSKTPNTGVIGLVVLSGPDFSSTPVEGAKITTDPSSPAYRYNSPQGLPTSQGTMTVADGLAYAFNAPAGAISVSATKSGSTFKPTTLSVRADALTQTIVAP